MAGNKDTFGYFLTALSNTTDARPCLSPQKLHYDSKDKVKRPKP